MSNCCRPLDDAVVKFLREYGDSDAALVLTFKGDHYHAYVDLPAGHLEFESKGDDWGEMLDQLLDKAKY